MADNVTYPVPTVNGTAVTVDWLLNSPKLIYRILRTLVQQQLVSQRLLTGRVDLTGSGFGIYEISESIFTAQNGSIVRPLSQYPTTTAGVPVLATVRPDKTGLKEIFSDEVIAHGRIDKVMRDLTKIANSLAFQADGVALAAIASLVVKTVTVTGTWDGTTNADPFQDVLLADASVNEEKQGYNVDTVVTTPTKFAYAISSAVKRGILPREAVGNVATSNINNIRIANQTWLKTTNMPPGVTALAADSSMLGSLAYERLGGGYQGDPADMSSGVETKKYRIDDSDGVTVQARIVRAPMVQEPNSARIFTGA
jgi:hypothetical protein